jgi:hypothetical protein
MTRNETLAAKRLAKNKDFEMILTAQKGEITDLILSENLGNPNYIMVLLAKYHALHDFGEFVAALAEEEADG